MESKRRLLAAPSSARWGAALALGVLVVVAAACSSGAATSTTTSTAAATASTGSSSAVVHVAKVGSLGTVLVNQSGLTLYRYTPDGTGKSVCTGTCASQWPPLTVPAGTTPAASGLPAADLGVIVRSDGSHQVTYKGMPLYTYSGDTKAGAATGQGLDGTWFVLTAATAAPTGATASTTATTSASGGYGY